MVVAALYETFLLYSSTFYSYCITNNSLENAQELVTAESVQKRVTTESVQERVTTESVQERVITESQMYRVEGGPISRRKRRKIL